MPNFISVDRLLISWTLFLLLVINYPLAVKTFGFDLTTRTNAFLHRSLSNTNRRILSVGLQLSGATDEQSKPDNDYPSVNNNGTGTGVAENVVASDSLLELLKPEKSCSVDRMSGTDLAYIGDVVFEVFIRSLYVWPPKRTSDLQNKVVSCVRAENQSRLLQILKQEYPLTEKEKQILTRGRNSTTKGSKNRRDPAAYQDSTAFEALIGFLYITDEKRCHKVLKWLLPAIEGGGSQQ